MSWIDHTEAQFYSYSGNSMNPLFHTGDYLKVVPYKMDEKIHIGDIIAFYASENDQYTVHRVISLKDGIWARGDNNPKVDNFPTSRENILGKVISVQKRDRVVTIHSGIRGYLQALPRWLWKDLDRNLSGIFHPIYRLLAKSGIFRILLNPWINPQVDCITESSGKIRMQVRLGTRIIAVYRPSKQSWHIRRPYRLILDEKTLPNQLPKKN